MFRRLLVAAAIAPSMFVHARADACTSDVQCKGDRICDAGVCVAHGELAPSPTVHAAQEDERGDPSWQTSGPGLGIGSGYQTAGFGAALAIYGQLTEVFRLAPWFGVGNLKKDQLFFMNFDTGNTVDKWGWAVGMMALFGRKHRFVLDFGYGLAGVDAQSTPTDRTILATYGITGAGGYEVMTRGGFFFRMLVGITHLNEDPRDPRYGYVPKTDRNPMTVTIILGAKPW